MANVLEFVKKNLTRVVVIGVASACVLAAGIVLIADRVAYANYEANYEKEAEELRATFPALPKSVIMDDNYVTFSADGSEVASTKSPYKKSFIYYARDAVIAPLNQNVAVEYERTDDTLLGEYMTGLDRKGGAITFTFRTPRHGLADIDISLKSNWVDENGVYHELPNISDFIKIQNNGLEIKTENLKLEVKDSWSHLILKDAFLLKGENTLTFTTSAYNDFGNKDNILYVMPDIRNVALMTDVDVYTPEFVFDTTDFKTDYRLIEIPDLSKIKVIKKIGDPEVSYAEEEIDASKLASSIDYDAGKVIIKCSPKVTKELAVTFDKSPEKNTINGEVDGKQVTIVVTSKDSAQVTVGGATTAVRIALEGKKGLANIRFLDEVPDLPKVVGLSYQNENVILVLNKYYTSTQKANTNTNGGTSQTGNTYFVMTAEADGAYLTAFWNWTYSGDKVACLKCEYTFTESNMNITLTSALTTNGVEQWNYVNNKSFTVSEISAGDVPDHLTSLADFIIY